MHERLNPNVAHFCLLCVPVFGRLGLSFDRLRYERGDGLFVREIVAQGPSAVEGSIKMGDRLLAVNGTSIGQQTNLDSLLENEIGKKVTVDVAPAGDASKKRALTLQPVSGPAETELRYRQWVERNRAYVERISGGKLGYVHIKDMSEAALDRLHIDLDIANQTRQGVVIDIRDNHGGFVNGYALDVCTRRDYLTMTRRGMNPAPARAWLGQRALGTPTTVLVTNEGSLSDAKDFTEGYRALKLGKVVGEPTAGWIIYTWGKQLIDGSVLRLPEARRGRRRQDDGSESAARGRCGRAAPGRIARRERLAARPRGGGAGRGDGAVRV